jgi:hypothetical protein
MVIREFVCMAHGDFEAEAPVCPRGCAGEGMVQRAFRTPVSIGGGHSRGINSTLETLASEHGLSDMNNRSGDGMRRADWQTHRRLTQATEMILGQGDRAGQDMSQYFKPLGSFNGALPQNIMKGDGGKTVLPGGIELNRPVAQVVASHDGTKAGLPAGDA